MRVRKLFWRTLVIGVVTLVHGCGGSERPAEPLFGSLEPGRAAEITAFLDRHHEPYILENTGRSMIVRVVPGRAAMIRAYLAEPVDSVRYVDLVRECRLSDRDSSRVHLVTPKSVRRFAVLKPDGPSDSTRIGEAFEALFENGVWKTQRTREKEIVVEFTGTVKQDARKSPFGKKVMEELTSHRDYLAEEVGLTGAVWIFRWRIGIEGKSFVKESVSVSLGGKNPGEKSSSGGILNIDL